MKYQSHHRRACVDAAERACRERKVPFTVQRRGVLDHLASRVDHPTADEVFDGLGPRLSGISRATVYRILEAFVEFGVVRKIDTPEARARFDADTSRHHHVHCSRCGALADVRAPAFDELPFPAETDAGFRISGYAVTFTGVCSACRESRTEATPL